MNGIVIGLTYYQRLKTKVWSRESRVKTYPCSLGFAYKIIFGLTDVNTEDIFTVRASDSRRGHGYKLYMPYSKSTARYNYFNLRVGGIWNALPFVEIDISSLRCFHNSLTAKVIVPFVD